MSFREDLDKGKAVCIEAIPPRGPVADIGHLLPLRGRISAINVTDNSISMMKMSSLAYSAILSREGFEPIMHMACRDRNRLALQSDLLGAHALGIRNVLAVTGDSPSLGDNKRARRVYDLDSVQLLSLIRSMNEGTAMNSKKLSSPTSFFAGCAVNAGSDLPEGQLLKARKKIDSGAGFMISQPVFDTERFLSFCNQMPADIRIIAGIIILRDHKHAIQLAQSNLGISIPQPVVDRMDGKGVDEGIVIAIETVAAIRGRISGVALMNVDFSTISQFLDRLSL